MRPKTYLRSWDASAALGSGIPDWTIGAGAVQPDNLCGVLAASGLSTKEISKATGASLRQLQYWEERKVVIARREGHDRNYSFDQAVVVGVIMECLRRGLSPPKALHVGKLLDRKRKRFKPHQCILTNGCSVLMYESVVAAVAKVVASVAKLNKPMVMIELRPIYARFAALAQMRTIA